LVNEAINNCFVDEEDHAELRESIDAYDNFDQIDLAQKIENHELLELRRVAAYIYKKAGRFTQSVELSKSDGMFKDAIDTVSVSNDKKLANELIRFFVENGDKECFCACLYTCYELVQPSVALEVAWRHGFIDFVMPYMIQFIADSNTQIESLRERVAKMEKEKEVVDPFDDGAKGYGGSHRMAIGATAFNPQPQMGAVGNPPMGGPGVVPQMGMGAPPPLGMQQPMMMGHPQMGTQPMGVPPPMGGQMGSHPVSGMGMGDPNPLSF